MLLYTLVTLTLTVSPVSLASVSSCHWDYKPSADKLTVDKPQVLDKSVNEMYLTPIWSGPKIGTSDGQVIQKFELSKSLRGNLIAVKKMVEEVEPVYVFTFALSGDLPEQAKAKGVTGNKWSQYLYFKNVPEGNCYFANFGPTIESISVQQLK